MAALDVSHEGHRDRSGDLVLDCKDIFDVPVITLGPDLATGARLDQLDRHSDSIAELAQAAVCYIGDSQDPADLAGRGISAAKAEGRVARDDKELPIARQLRDD